MSRGGAGRAQEECLEVSSARRGGSPSCPHLRVPTMSCLGTPVLPSLPRLDWDQEQNVGPETRTRTRWAKAAGAGAPTTHRSEPRPRRQQWEWRFLCVPELPSPAVLRPQPAAGSLSLSPCVTLRPPAPLCIPLSPRIAPCHPHPWAVAELVNTAAGFGARPRERMYFMRGLSCGCN